jgi:hypothetical protein
MLYGLHDCVGSWPPIALGKTDRLSIWSTPMNNEPEDESQSRRTPASHDPVSPEEDQQAREAALRRPSLRDRLLQVLEWLYPYSADQTRNSRHK